jgi:glycosyltransferase involved in cell wall biosynthesis
MARPRVAIVVPAFNEGVSVGAVVTRCAQFGTPIVVDDGSQDGTAANAALAGADVVRHEKNRGYDRAIDSGFARAAALDCDIVVTVDADGQHDPALLQQFIAQVAEGSDVAIGIRERRQRLSEHVFAWVSRRLWGISDPLCGMKAYRMAVYRKLGHFDSYGSIGTELAIFAVRQGYRISEIPIRTRERIGSSRFGRSMRGNWAIMRALLLALTRRPRQTDDASSRTQLD